MSMSYVTCQIRPTQFLKDMSYKTKKFAIECETPMDVYGVCANLSSLEGINYIYTRKSKPSKKDYIFLSSKDNSFLKHLHL